MGSNTILKQILDYVNSLEERGHSDAALVYLDKELSSCLSEDHSQVNAALAELPIHLYSTPSLLYLLTLTYYYRAGLPNRALLFEAVYNELCFIRGLREAEEALLVIQ